MDSFTRRHFFLVASRIERLCRRRSKDDREHGQERREFKEGDREYHFVLQSETLNPVFNLREQLFGMVLKHKLLLLSSSSPLFKTASRLEWNNGKRQRGMIVEQKLRSRRQNGGILPDRFIGWATPSSCESHGQSILAMRYATRVETDVEMGGVRGECGEYVL